MLFFQGGLIIHHTSSVIFENKNWVHKLKIYLGFSEIYIVIYIYSLYGSVSVKSYNSWLGRGCHHMFHIDISLIRNKIKPHCCCPIQMCITASWDQASGSRWVNQCYTPMILSINHVVPQFIMILMPYIHKPMFTIIKYFLSFQPYMQLFKKFDSVRWVFSVSSVRPYYLRFSSCLSDPLCAQAVTGEISPFPLSLHRRVSSFLDHDMRTVRLFSKSCPSQRRSHHPHCCKRSCWSELQQDNSLIFYQAFTAKSAGHHTQLEHYTQVLFFLPFSLIFAACSRSIQAPAMQLSMQGKIRPWANF